MYIERLNLECPIPNRSRILEGYGGGLPLQAPERTQMSKRKYLVLLRNQSTSRPPGGSSGPSPEQLQQMFASYNAWKDKFKNEILDMGDKLNSEGRIVTASGVADGPYIEAKELVGGYMIVSASSFDDAVAVVRACPAVNVPGVSMEIREMAGMRM
jgi:hypothetical protein